MATNPFSDVGGRIGQIVLTGSVWLIAIIVLGGLLLGVVFYVRYRKKYDIFVKIRSERSEDKHKVNFDNAAIISDPKTKSKYFKLKNQRVELPVPPFNVLQTSSKGDYIELWRKSEDEYVYLTPPVIDKEFYMRADGKLYPMSDLIQKQVEGDIAYWNVTRKPKNKQLFDTESWLMKLLPFIPQIIGGVIALFILYILFNSLPSVLNSLTELTKELASLKGAELSST